MFKIRKIIAFLLLLGILILLFILFTKQKKDSLLTSVRPTATPIPNQNEPTSFLSNMVVKEFTWKKLTRNLPLGLGIREQNISKDEGIEVKQSPQDNFSAFITKDYLIIKERSDKSTEIKIPISKDQESANFVWLTEDYILLIEKEKAFRKIDRIYLLNKNTKDKQFFAGSFPITARLNLNVEPRVDRDGKEVILQDMEGIYWQLSLKY